MKKILITGAASGIGRNTAFELARRGHDVIASTRTAEQVTELKKAAGQLGLKLTVEKLDIREARDREEAEKWGVDILLNNAGIGEAGPLAEIPLERVRRNFETNVFATLALTQGIVKEMLKKGSGRIITVTSLAGRIPVPTLGAYSMTKFALEAACDVLRRELKPHNISVSVIEPGPYATGFNERMMKAKSDWFNGDSVFASGSKAEKRYERMLMHDQYPVEGVVDLIVKVIESPKPRFRYVTPLKYKLAVGFLRVLGK